MKAPLLWIAGAVALWFGTLIVAAGYELWLRDGASAVVNLVMLLGMGTVACGALLWRRA